MSRFFINIFLVVFMVSIPSMNATICGCKMMRDCYMEMVETLKDKDEESCIDDASIGVSSVLVFLKAVQQFCSEVISINEDALTYEGRKLYEVILSAPSTAGTKRADDDSEDVIIIEAGQYAGTESVGFVLYLIEQLVGCQENNEMLTKVKWVMLPSVNPDGMEYGRYNRITWRKNVKPSEDGLSYGVDISRNFDYKWNNGEQTESGFSMEYPGPSAGSENETIFIKNILAKHKANTKIYLSIRRDGHAILYPYGYGSEAIANGEEVINTAGNVAAKVNQRAGGVQMFTNTTIFEYNGKAHSGHSVDYAYNEGIAFSYEMRVFLGNDNRIMSRFQQLPRGYDASLRLGYFSGIRELYNSIAHMKSKRKA